MRIKECFSPQVCYTWPVLEIITLQTTSLLDSYSCVANHIHSISFLEGLGTNNLI